MKATNLCLLVSSAFAVTLATAGCLQDYDEFQFGAGGAGSTATGTTAAPGPTTSGPGQTTTTTNGPTTTSGPTSTTNTTNTTNTVASTTMSSTTGGPIGPTVDCAGEICDIGAGETCCIDGSQNGSCSMGACGSDIPVECDEQADCGGEICCLFENGSGTVSVECASDCTGPDEDPICSGPGDPPCQNPTTCEPAPEMPAGFESCQF